MRLMREAWKPEWGNYEVFKRWVYDEAEGDPPPVSVKRAVATYRGRAE
jgi:hypothetical protein